MSEIEPKPCPFCGKPPKSEPFKFIDDGPNDRPYHMIRCGRDKHDVRVCEPNKDRAIAVWNARELGAWKTLGEAVAAFLRRFDSDGISEKHIEDLRAPAKALHLYDGEAP